MNRRRHILALSVALLALLALTACSKADNGTEAGLPNPAAVYCQDQGHQHEIRTDADGSQYGVCILTDGTECEEWAYYRGECGPGVVEAVDPTATAEPEPAPASVATFEEAPCPFKLPAGQVEGETIEPVGCALPAS